MPEQEHILDTLLNKVREDLKEGTEIYLARDEEDNEVLAVNTKDWQKGLNIEQIVHSFAVYRIYQTDSEEAALNELAKSILASIDNMMKE